MAIVWILVAAAVVALVGWAMRQERAARQAQEPRPGEGLPRHDLVLNVPESMVPIRRALQTSEAHVVLGLLTSAGIAAALKPTPPQVLDPRVPVQFMDVLVDIDRAEEADALLAGSVDDDSN